MTNTTKERLKALAGSPLLQEEKHQPTSEQENNNVQQHFTSRPIPKALFAALITSPIFLVGLVFMQGTKMPGESSLSQSLVPPATAEELESLRAQLSEATAQLDDAQAKLAVVKQEKNKTPRVVPKEKEISQPEERKRSPVSPPSPVTATRPAPPRPAPRSIPRPQPVTATRSAPPRPAPPPQPVAKSALATESESLPTVYGAGAPSSEKIVGEKPQIENASLNTVNIVEQDSDPDALLAQSPSDYSPELEAPLLQEQPLALIRAGTSVRANLVTPYVKDFSSDSLEETYYSITLNETLYSEDGQEILPTGTVVLVQAQSSPANLVNFVAVEAVLPGKIFQNIPLPEGTIGFRSPQGGPLLAQPLEDSSQLAETLGVVIEGVEQALEISRTTSDGDFLGNLLTGGRQTRSIVDGIRHLVASPRAEQRQQQIMFLPSGAELELYVAQDFAIPSSEIISDFDEYKSLREEATSVPSPYSYTHTSPSLAFDSETRVNHFNQEHPVPPSLTKKNVVPVRFSEPFSIVNPK